MITVSPPVGNAWCVYDGFTFLMHVEAPDEAEARQEAASKTGLNKRLTVFLEDDTVTTFAGRNTFTLFQKYGGLSMDWLEMYCQVGPISRAHFRSMVDCVMKWVETPAATLAAVSVGSDLGYVRARLDGFNKLLGEPRWAYKSWIKIELGRDDDRQADRANDMADAYSNYLYTSSPED